MAAEVLLAAVSFGLADPAGKADTGMDMDQALAEQVTGNSQGIARA